MVSLVDLSVIILIFLIITALWWYLSIPSNLPPGPFGLPIFGSAFDTWRASTLHKPLHKWTQKYGPIYRLYIGNKLVVVLGDWSTIHEALVKQGDTFGSVRRRIMENPTSFRFEHTARFGFGRPILEPHIKDEAEYLLEAISNNKGQPFDPAHLLSNAVSNVICALVFGKRFQYEDEKFQRLLRLLRFRFTEADISVLTPMVLSEQMCKLMAHLPAVKRLKSANAELINFIKSQTSETLASFKSDDFVEPSNYIEAFYKAEHTNKEDNWAFTERQLIASVSNLFFAGTDTTATTLRWAIFLMAYHPQIQERVFEEIRKETGGQSLLNYAERLKLPFTEATIMETQRVADLIPFGIMRRTLAPSKLFGYDIPEGKAILPLLTGALNDPKVYPDPDKFDPNRFLQANKEGGKQDVFTHLIPFQVSKRICLGESLAIMELFVFFTALISRYKFYFPPNEPRPPLEARVSLFRAPIPFQICAERRTD